MEPADFAIIEGALPAPGAGEAVLQPLALSVDPSLRVQLTGLSDFVPSLPLGAPIYSYGVAKVVESRIDGIGSGDVVTGLMAWAETFLWMPVSRHPLGSALLEKVHPLGGTLEKVDPAIQPSSRILGALGTTGLTAYFGMLEVGRPRPGETVLVSGAAGAIGSVAGQIARMEGSRVVGLASTPEKRSILVDQLGFDAALDYRASDFREQLAALMPNGPDLYFDNVGGRTSNAVMWSMRRGTRVIECGQIATYDEPGGGWNVDIRPIHVNGLRFESFTTFHFQRFFPFARAQLSAWLASGELRDLETRLEGLDAAPGAITRMFAGENVGKTLITFT